ncbi:MAG: hypothetical protein ACKV2T_33735 [Kofleriaceae bacterium]
MKRFVLVAVMMASVVACGGTEGNDGNGRPSGSNGGGGTGTDTCPEIVDCVGDCSTDSCVSTCIGHGTTDAQLQFVSLAGCIEQERCESWDCIEDKCGAFVDACFEDAPGSGSGGGGGSGGGPQGTPLPSEIVGTWSSSDYRTLINYQFGPDGTVVASSALATGFNGCNSSWTTQWVGVAQWGANSMLSIQSTSGSQTTYDCSGTNVQSMGSYSITQQYAVAVGSDAEGDLLQLTNVSTGNAVTYRRE